LIVRVVSELSWWCADVCVKDKKKEKKKDDKKKVRVACAFVHVSFFFRESRRPVHAGSIDAHKRREGSFLV
jgi:hypothetical protein